MIPRSLHTSFKASSSTYRTWATRHFSSRKSKVQPPTLQTKYSQPTFFALSILATTSLLIGYLTQKNSRKKTLSKKDIQPLIMTGK